MERLALPSKKIDFIGNSITCGYGNDGLVCFPTHYSYETQNHYLFYAQIAARQLGAVAYIAARSGIGVYRNYNGPRTGTPDNRIDVQYEYTMYAEKSAFRREGGAMNERWDFSRFQPDVVCINLGTNDLSTNNYDTTLLKQGYKKLLRMVRQHNSAGQDCVADGNDAAEAEARHLPPTAGRGCRRGLPQRRPTGLPLRHDAARQSGLRCRLASQLANSTRRWLMN